MEEQRTSGHFPVNSFLLGWEGGKASQAGDCTRGPGFRFSPVPGTQSMRSLQAGLLDLLTTWKDGSAKFKHLPNLLFFA